MRAHSTDMYPLRRHTLQNNYTINKRGIVGDDASLAAALPLRFPTQKKHSKTISPQKGEMKMKKNYLTPEIEVTMISTEDVISTSMSVELPWLETEI